LTEASDSPQNPRVLIKVRKLGSTFSAPQIVRKDGQLVLQAEMIGELLKVPEAFRDDAELLVGELSMTFFPVGIEVNIEDGGELNGLWVQKGIFDAVRNKKAIAA
jgi:hypothetical protein